MDLVVRQLYELRLFRNDGSGNLANDVQDYGTRITKHSGMFDVDGNRIHRLDAIKLVLDEFIARREGDRIALLVFGSAPYVQAPFTQDHELVRQMLFEAEVAMPGSQTMLGDALGLAI